MRTGTRLGVLAKNKIKLASKPRPTGTIQFAVSVMSPPRVKR